VRARNQNIENNPMQRKEPLEKKGVAGMGFARKKHFDMSGKSGAHRHHPKNCRPPDSGVLPQSAAPNAALIRAYKTR
jgi:hypothetical protein